MRFAFFSLIHWAADAVRARSVALESRLRKLRDRELLRDVNTRRLCRDL